MKLWRQAILSGLMLSFCLVAAQANALTGDEIMDRVDAVMSAPKDSTGSAVMILVDKDDKKKERQMQMWTRFFKEKDDWSVTKFISPPEVRNLGFLSLADDQMYLYLPAFDRVRRIASHTRKESFAGSDLSNDDLSTGKYSENYGAQIAKETDTEYVLELKRKPGSNRIYPRITAWVNKTEFYVSRMELYDENEKLWKTMELENKKIQGYWTMVSIKVTDVRKDHRTILNMSEVKYDTGLEDDIFSQRFLKRRVRSD